ncbi:MAG: hypothetical protein AB1938_03780 [Myxococcota bacterium]
MRIFVTGGAGFIGGQGGEAYFVADGLAPLRQGAAATSTTAL